MKSLFVNSFILFISVIIGYLIVETSLRLLFHGGIQLPRTQYADRLVLPDARLGWVMQPNQVAHKSRLDYSVLVRSNSKGHADIERSYEKPEGTFRIVVLGDSFMEGAHVAEGERFVDRLGALLAGRGVEVINLGIGAYGTAQSLLMLQHEGLRYDPDLVLLGFYAENDLQDNHRGLSEVLWGADDWRTFARPYAVLDASRDGLIFEGPDFLHAQAMYEVIKAYRKPFWERIPLLETSVTSQALRKISRARKTKVFTSGSDPNVAFGAYLQEYQPQLRKGQQLSFEVYEEMWREAEQVTWELVKGIHGLSVSAGVPFVLFTVPAKTQVEPPYLEVVQRQYPGMDLHLRRIEEFLLDLGAAEGFPVLDLVPAFRRRFAETGERLHYFRDDSHWNPLGHAFAAQEVLEALERLQLVPAA